MTPYLQYVSAVQGRGGQRGKQISHDLMSGTMHRWIEGFVIQAPPLAQLVLLSPKPLRTVQQV